MANIQYSIHKKKNRSRNEAVFLASLLCLNMEQEITKNFGNEAVFRGLQMIQLRILGKSCTIVIYSELCQLNRLDAAMQCNSV